MPVLRADAQRNRDKIVAAARAAFAEPGADVSMAEVSRRAGVGMATLYRNFPGRRELLEALYADEGGALCESAARARGGGGGAEWGGACRLLAAQVLRVLHEQAARRRAAAGARRRRGPGLRPQ